MNDNITKHFRMPKSHPVLAEITIDAMKWYRFQCVSQNAPELNIVGYDDPVDGRITVYVACASEDVRAALEDGWN